MKKIFLILAIIFLLPCVFATNLQITKESSGESLIVGLEQPVTFNLKIKNLEHSDNFEFYNFLGFNMFPKGTVYLPQSQTIDVILQLYPLAEITTRGYYTFTYYIKGENSSEILESLTFKMIDLKDAFTVGSEEMVSELNSIEVYIKNKENFNFTDIKAEFSSPFFKFEKEFSLEPYETKNFTVELNKDDFKELIAGFYTLRAKLKVKDLEDEVTGIIRFDEKDLVITTKEDYGLIIHTQILEKINKGNVVASSETIFKKNIISRLFTTFSPEPDLVERKGVSVYYTWNRQIKPGEILEIVVKTNWIFPFLTIILIVLIVIFVKKFTGTDVSLAKKVSFVRTKGGEFALKVTVFVRAKRYVERVSVIDRLPNLVKVHERFGAEQPTKINEKLRRIEWNFEKLEAGEARVLSYIVYSKIGILGKFVLPSATAIFEREGSIKETESNRAFFVSEQKAEKEKLDDGY